LLAALGDCLTAKAAAGCLTDDQQRPPDQLTAHIRGVVSRAGQHADDLAAELNAVRNLAATLHTADSAAPAA
jgi:hypothetical protein